MKNSEQIKDQIKMCVACLCELDDKMCEIQDLDMVLDTNELQHFYIALLRAIGDARRVIKNTHGEIATCRYCNHRGLLDTDFAEEDCCHICIKR